jgi:hypothetical protein
MGRTGVGIETSENHNNNGDKTGICRMFLIITGVPNPPPQGDPAPGRQVRFKIFYTVAYALIKTIRSPFVSPFPLRNPFAAVCKLVPQNRKEQANLGRAFMSQ